MSSVSVRIVAALAALGFAGMASAQTCPCSTNKIVSYTALQTLLTGKTVCATFTNGDRWQEYHQADGTLVELGSAGPAAGGGKVVGTWAIMADGNNGRITYNYSGGSSYSYSVCSGNAGQGNSGYAFCGAVAITAVNVVAGTGACPGTGYTRGNL